jgi:hypothetical protein
MGIKSTQTISRSEAIVMYHDLRAKLYNEANSSLTNHELGNVLDRMAEEWADRNNRACFDNFLVVNDDELTDG